MSESATPPTSPAAQAARAVEHAEIALSPALSHIRERPPVRVAAKLAKLGDQQPLYAASVALALAGLLLRRPGVVRAGLRAGVAVALSDVAKRLIKLVVRRSRPRAVIDGAEYARGLGGSHDKRDQSFPSGHMAASTAAARAVCRVYPGAVAPAATLVIALGATRVAQGEHWPTDIAAGALIGLGAEAVSNAILGPP